MGVGIKVQKTCVHIIIIRKKLNSFPKNIVIYLQNFAQVPKLQCTISFGNLHHPEL